MKKINGIVKIGVPSYPIGVNGNQPCHQCYADVTLLESLPTVDAIPVSWIMARVAERKERGTAFDLSVASTLRTMVEEWYEQI